MREESVGQILQSEVVPVGAHGEVPDYLPLDKGLVAMLDVVCSSTKKPKNKVLSDGPECLYLVFE